MNSNLGIFFILICFLLFGEKIVEGISVECEYVYLPGYYSCDLKPQNISGFETVTHVDGIHLTGEANEDVEVIDFTRMRFDRMPKDLNKFFTNVEIINLDGTGIKTLLKEHLVNFPKLKFLFAYSNELESLQSDLFEGNSNMKRISFGSNKLKSIGSDLLKPLTKLEHAWFYGNPCISKYANSETEIEELRTELIAKCSPSPEMLQNQILLGQNEILKAENSRLKAELAAALASPSKKEKKKFMNLNLYHRDQ